MVDKQEEVKESSGVEVFNPLNAALKTENIDISKVQAELIEDETETNDDKKKKVNKPDKEVESVEDTETHENDDVADEDADKDTSDDEDTTKDVVFSEEYNQAKKEISDCSRRIQDLIEEVKLLEPEKPTDTEDIDAQEQYESELKDYRRQANITNKRVQKLQNDIRERASVLQNEFANAHKKDDLTGFQNFMKNKPGYLAEFLTGQEDLEFFYRIYKMKNEDKLSKVKKVTKAYKKPISIDGNGPSNSSGGLLPNKYVYANKQVFKDWVGEMKRDMESGKKMPDGKPITEDLIEALCKQEWSNVPKEHRR